MRTLLALLLLTTTAAAQQAPDPKFLQDALTAIQAQRNAAWDSAAGIEARLKSVLEENERLKKELADAKQKSSAGAPDGGSGAQPPVR